MKLMNSIYLDNHLGSKEELFKIICSKSRIPNIKDNYQVIKRGLMNRELVSDTLISNKVAMPHYQNNRILNSQIFFVGLKNSISWNSNGGSVIGVVCILLAGEETKQQLTHISSVVRRFADEVQVNKLFQAKDKQQFIANIAQFERNSD